MKRQAAVCRSGLSLTIWHRCKHLATLQLALALAFNSALATEPTKADSARVNYILNCQGCHLSDGRGYPGKVPNMNGYIGNFLRVEGGREFLVRVPGSATSTLDSAQLAAVLNWLLTEFSADQLPQPFIPYAAEEVERLRQRPFTDVELVRAKLVKQINALAAAGS